MSHDQAMTTVQEPTAMEPTAMEKDEAKVREITIFAMTIGELLDLLDNYPHDDSSTADEPLRLILICAACFYDDRECDLRSTALYLARLALQEDSIGKETAAAMAHYMAMLADEMLRQAERAEEIWDNPTLVALRKIRRSAPKVANA
jgi:hypothetical protein